ncbi:glycosyltransferase [Halobacterium salinarum]|uniref:glycosyltransferase n=1 Tax=Halobacterium salinarum TaxID=2242 RepID=UPI002553ED65|nr:glycosyltransferase [Halobacterium salinarum]MDL0126512.1 glycosyltransferase [Halobacterium salinarum]
MRIAVLVNDFPSISETFIIDQITGLIELGHEVYIFPKAKPNQSAIHQRVKDYELISKTSYPNIPDNKVTRILSGSQVFIDNLLNNPKQSIESLNFVRYGRDALSLRLLHSVATFNNGDFDLIFSHFGPNGNRGALLKRTGTDATLVTVFHGYDVQLALNKRSNPYAPAFTESDAILVNSESNKQKLIDSGAPQEKIIKHPIGVDTDTFEFRWTEDDKINSADTITITTVGRLVEEKGYEYALQAVARIHDDLPPIEYRIVGDGPKRNELEALVENIGIEEIVHFHGEVEQQRVEEILSSSHIFLLASVKEGFGKVLLEAQSVGLPVVATNTGGIPEAVEKGESALLVPPGEPESLAEQLQYLCENPSLWRTMGEIGRQYVEQEYDIHQLNKRLEQIFRDLSC